MKRIESIRIANWNALAESNDSLPLGLWLTSPAKNRDQLWNSTLGNGVWATFTFFYFLAYYCYTTANVKKAKSTKTIFYIRYKDKTTTELSMPGCEAAKGEATDERQQDACDLARYKTATRRDRIESTLLLPLLSAKNMQKCKTV